MRFTRPELEDRALALQIVADARGLCWQPGVRGLPADDPVALIGHLALVLDIDLFAALDPHTPPSRFA